MSTEHVQILDPCLNVAAGTWNTYSQFGEDSLIAAALERVGAVNRWCFEVGAADGQFFSNTRRLIERGWNAILIEADDQNYAKLAQFAGNAGNIRCVHEKVGPDSLDRILAQHGAPRDLDLGVIDIDGQDYWVWQGMSQYQPRLMLVEFARYAENSTAEVLPALGDASGAQATIGYILQLGREKGYRAIAQTYVNVLFCLEALLT